ncbi:MAG: hypothetical protein GYB53_22140 [Rhodobacteraceae bacterium]|nr:hypothetical protein [Paracoccaceae bacterium]MBR9823705.1 hypothetical protein [Paracoccaceae bacterium]
MIDHLADRYKKLTRPAPRPLAETLAEGLAWICAAAAVAAFTVYAASDAARQHVAPEAFLGGQR